MEAALCALKSLQLPFQAVIIARAERVNPYLFKELQ